MLDEGSAGTRARGGRHFFDWSTVGSVGEERGQQGGGSCVPEGDQRDVLCGDQLENWRKYRVCKPCDDIVIQEGRRSAAQKIRGQRILPQFGEASARLGLDPAFLKPDNGANGL